MALKKAYMAAAATGLPNRASLLASFTGVQHSDSLSSFLVDKSGNGNDATIVDIPMLTATGSETFSNADYDGTETVVDKSGTATVAATSGGLTIGAGTLYWLEMSNGSIYYCEDGTADDPSVFLYDASGNNRHLYIAGYSTAVSLWATRRDTGRCNLSENGYRRYCADGRELIGLYGWSELGDDGTDNIATEITGGWRLQSDGTAGLGVQIMLTSASVIGQKFIITFYVSDLSAGEPTCFIRTGSSNSTYSITRTGWHTVELESREGGSVVMYFYRQSGTTTDVSVTDISAQHKVTAYLPVTPGHIADTLDVWRYPTSIVMPETTALIAADNDRQPVGVTEIYNGDFADDLTNWSTSGTWEHSTGGGAKHTPGNSSSLYQNTGKSGETRHFTLTVTGMTAGQVKVQPGLTSGTWRTENGTYSEVLTYSSNGMFYLVPSSDFDGVVTLVEQKATNEPIDLLFSTGTANKIPLANFAASPWTRTSINNQYWCYDNKVAIYKTPQLDNNLNRLQRIFKHFTLKIGIMTDTHFAQGDEGFTEAMIDVFNSRNVDMVISPGDQYHNETNWTNLALMTDDIEVYEGLFYDADTRQIMLGTGNHDYPTYGDFDDFWAVATLSKENSVIEHGNYRIINIFNAGSPTYTADTEALTFLSDEMASAVAYDQDIILLMHTPLNGTQCIQKADILSAITTAQGNGAHVRMILTGHNHIYGYLADLESTGVGHYMLDDSQQVARCYVLTITSEAHNLELFEPD